MYKYGQAGAPGGHGIVWYKHPVETLFVCAGGVHANMVGCLPIMRSPIHTGWRHPHTLRRGAT